MENLLKKGEKSGPGNYRGITLLSTVGKKIFTLSNDRMGTVMEMEEKKNEGEAGIRPIRKCVNHAYTLGKVGKA